MPNPDKIEQCCAVDSIVKDSREILKSLLKPKVNKEEVN